MRRAILVMLSICALAPALALASANLDHSDTTTLSAGLVGYWPLDGGTLNWRTGTAADASGQGNAGKLVGMSTSTSPALGKIGQALAFGSGRYIEVPYSASLAPTAGFTGSAWFKYGGETGTEQRLFSKTQNGGYALFLNANATDVCSPHMLCVTIYIGGSYQFVQYPLSNLVAGRWYQVATTYNGSAVVLYVDGVAVGSTPASGPISYSVGNSFCIGQEPGATACSVNDYVNGPIDDVRIYNRGLSPQEMAHLYAMGAARVADAGATALSSGLSGYWPLDGDTTNWKTDTTADLSGNGDTGALVNMSTTTSPAVGKIGGAINFNGSSSDISIPNASALNPGTGSFTVSAWVKEQRFVTSMVIAAKSDGGGASAGYGWHLAVFTGNVVELHFATGGSFTVVSNSTALSAGAWHHVVAVVDRGNISNSKIYIDGSAAGTSVSDGGNSGSISNTVPLAIGSESDDQFNWSGAIDDVRVYDRALSPQEVAQLYAMGETNVAHAGASLSPSGLIGYWTFDGGSINWNAKTIADSSAKADTLSMGGYNAATSTALALGKLGQALKFNGSTQYLSHANVSAFNFGTGDFSVSFWMKPSSPWGTVATVGLIGQKTDDPYNGWQIYQDSGHPGHLDMRITQQNNFLTNATIAAGKWTYATFVRKGGSTYWYLNGALDASGFNAASISDPGAFYIGYAPTWTAFYDGALDDVRIYSRALSPQEIAQLYAAGK